MNDSRNDSRNIHRKNVREGLPVRNEPYFRQLSPGQHIGVRKGLLGDKWVAKYKRNTKTLGSGLTYTQALKLAEEWFASCKLGVVQSITVREACELYVENIRVTKGDTWAKDPERMFKLTAYSHPIADMPLDKLRASDIESWRNALVTPKRKKQSVNRIYRTVKAALNFAYKRQLVSSDHAWRVVGPLPCTEGRREKILSLKERRAILSKASTDLGRYLEGLLHTAARPTELTQATVGDLDLRTRTLSLTSRKGQGIARTRTVPLSNAAYSLFKAQSRGKLPGAYLFPMYASGEPWNNTQLSRKVREIAMPGVVCYTMRHTTISEWLSAGIDIATVSAIAGTSIAMIQKHYFKYIKTDVADKLSAIQVC